MLSNIYKLHYHYKNLNYINNINSIYIQQIFFNLKIKYYLYILFLLNNLIFFLLIKQNYV